MGFRVVDELARRECVAFESAPAEALVARLRLGAEPVLLVKPLTMMNLSGEAVGALARYYKVEIGDLLVVADDVSLPLGRLRARARGSAGGHNGFKSIRQHLGTDAFARLRVGVGRGDARRDLADHVLATFAADERQVIEDAIAAAADAVVMFVAEGIEPVMNRFNAPPAAEEERSESQERLTKELAGEHTIGRQHTAREGQSTVNSARRVWRRDRLTPCPTRSPRANRGARAGSDRCRGRWRGARSRHHRRPEGVFMSTRKYELVYVVSPELSDEQVTAVHDQVQAIVTRFGAEIEKTDNWGRRKLAYEIGHHKEGTYVLEVINGTGELMKEIDRRLKVVTDSVIRHIVVRVDEEERVVNRTRTRRTSQQHRRRIARGLPPEVQEGEKRRDSDDRDDGGFDEAGV